MRQLSLRRNFGWSLVGATTFGLAQWVSVAGLARISDPEAVGQYSLILAICAPVYLSVGLNLRIAIATDASQRWELADYLRTRQLLVVLSFVISVGAGVLVWDIRGEFLASLVALALAKGSEAYSQTLYGYLQLMRRLDVVALSLFGRGLLGVIGLLGGYAISGRLSVACLGQLIAWQMTLWSWDRLSVRRIRAAERSSGGSQDDRHWQWGPIRSIIAGSFPLGVDAGIRSLALVAPRFVVAAQLGTGSLGVFAVLATFALIPTLVTGSLGAAAIPVLAKCYSSGDRPGYIRIFGRILIVSTCVCVAFLGFIYVGGGAILRVLIGDEFDYPVEFIAVTAAYSVAVMQGVLIQGIQATRRFSIVVIADLITLLFAALAAVALVPSQGLIGAAFALGLGMGASGVFLVVALLVALRSMPSGRGPGVCNAL